MTYSKSYLTLVLEKEFQDPKKAFNIQKRTLDILKDNPGSASRIFDNLPCLLPKKTMLDISKKCLKILSTMDVASITYESTGIHVNNKEDQERISIFIKEIIALGIKELLNDNGHIKAEIIKLFGWESIKDQLGRSELTITILCGYVGAINQEIVANFAPHEVSALTSSYTGFFGYLNEKNRYSSYIKTNMRQWVIEQLKATGFEFKTISDVNTLLNWPSKHPEVSTLIVLAAITTASSIVFFKNNSAKNSSIQTLEKGKHMVLNKI